MEASPIASVVRLLASLLEWPTLIALVGMVILALWEVSLGVGERARGVCRLAEKYDEASFMKLARRRIERADLLARLGPMLGLMGTLVPLGPGLAALGRGDVAQLAGAVTVAFDTTVLGMLVGICGFVLGRVRRRWYDDVLTRIEHAAT